MTKALKINTKNFIFSTPYIGWGRKKSGFQAVENAKKHNTSFCLLEDGFIRSIGLGVDKWESFSIVKDNVGIYYDATAPSKLEQLIKENAINQEILKEAKEAIELIKKYKISKYNTAPLTLPSYLQTDTKKVLIIAQTKGDMSLKYGLATDANKMVEDALEENPDLEVYIKIHPDVLSGKKESSIDIEKIKKCKVIKENINPIVLLEQFNKVYTQTSQMGFEALLLDKEVVLYGAPFYVGWKLPHLTWRIDEETKKTILKRRGVSRSIEEIFTSAYIFYTEYYNPYTKQKTNIIESIQMIEKYKNIYSQNDGKLFFFGFSLWKQKNTKIFFKPLTNNIIYFCKDLKDAQTKGLDDSSKIFIWGKKEFSKIELFAKQHNITISRVEDGFIRSISLGSDLTKAYSLVIDNRGIYFDPTQESDLEHILQNYQFDEKLLTRAQKLKEYLVEKKLSKYNANKDTQLTFHTTKKIILVIGQVEDDASIIYGGENMTNLELLQKVHQQCSNEYIIYKPHPDVLAGNRKGDIRTEDVLTYADELQKDISLPSLLDICDELHTITSLSGFEALLRGKKVVTYGMPFYAGWGLTTDKKTLERRSRKLTLTQLIAATYILYPRYIHPKDDSFCEVEVLLKEIESQKKKYTEDTLYRTFIKTRNYISRKLQLIRKVIVELFL
jgi:capsular polysaccharide export protein